MLEHSYLLEEVWSTCHPLCNAHHHQRNTTVCWVCTSPCTPSSHFQKVQSGTCYLASLYAFCTMQCCSSQICVWCLQFVNTLEANVEELTGSPVKVSILSYKSGSVVVTESYAFLDNSATGASSLIGVLKSRDSSSVFGTSFGPVAVNTSSVTSGPVTNPSSELPLHPVCGTLSLIVFFPPGLLCGLLVAK